MSASSTVTTTVQVSGSPVVPNQSNSYSDANANSPGGFEYIALTNTPTALTIPPDTEQVVIYPLGAAVSSGTPLYVCMGGTGVALANMARAPVGTITGGVITASSPIKWPVVASSPVLELACDDSGAHSCGLSNVAIWFV